VDRHARQSRTADVGELRVRVQAGDVESPAQAQQVLSGAAGDIELARARRKVWWRATTASTRVASAS
jgi:hypothetical protein